MNILQIASIGVLCKAILHNSRFKKMNRISGQHIGITVKDLHFFTQSSRGVIQRNDSVGGVALRLSDSDWTYVNIVDTFSRINFMQPS